MIRWRKPLLSDRSERCVSPKTQQLNVSVFISQSFRCQTPDSQQHSLDVVTKWILLCLFITISTPLKVNVKVLSHIFIGLGPGGSQSCAVLC